MKRIVWALILFSGASAGDAFAQDSSLAGLWYSKRHFGPEVRGELVRCRAKQFDPEIADRLLTSDFWRTLFPPAGRRTPTPRFLSLIGNASMSKSRSRA